MLGGYQKADGIVKVKGSEIDLTTSVNGDGQARRAQGIAHVPEDRQREGLIMDFMAWENSVFVIIARNPIKQIDFLWTIMPFEGKQRVKCIGLTSDP